MGIHKIQMPAEILIGEGVTEKVGDVCKDLLLSGACLLVSGPKTIGIGGKRVSEVLSGAGYPVETEVVESIEKHELGKLIERAREYRFMVAVGGGRVIDIAKYASFRAGIPFISVPTAPSHDGIASPRATLSENHTNYSFLAHVPEAIVADTAIMAKAPQRLIAAGAGDMIGKLTAIEDWKLSAKVTGETFSDYASALTLLSANMVVDSAEMIKNREERGLRNLVESLISSSIAMCITGNSRPASGSEHMFSHALDSILPEGRRFHGEQVAIGCIMMSYLHGLPWQRIRATIREIGCPITASELGVGEKDIIRALVLAGNIRKDRYTILEQKALNAHTAEDLARKTGIIP